MRFSPTLRFGEVLVVLEGPARVLWKEPAPERASHWTPTGIWPDEGQLAMVRAHLESGRPLLVLLDEARDPVPMLREEWQAAPCRLLENLTGACHGDLVDDEVVELRLPFLDCALAENLIRRGRSRCAGCAGSRARTLESVLSRDWRSPRHDGCSCCYDWLT
ncbi:hypothetical protein ACFYY3_25095 [Streptomyces sp. NPDC001812]|uniref:hypothetical protein n=1 Tax=Streptomyces sp. NPDC001812 TaxID=3364611 RepID=UPI00368BBC4D